MVHNLLPLYGSYVHGGIYVLNNETVARPKNTIMYPSSMFSVSFLLTIIVIG